VSRLLSNQPSTSLVKDPIPGRADKDLVNAYMGRHVRNEGDCSAQVLRLKHFRHDLLARWYGPLLHDVCRDLTRAQRARANAVFVLLDVELMRERDDRGFRGRIGWPDQIADMPASP
jgi:dephospho-CoA kinase